MSTSALMVEKLAIMTRDRGLVGLLPRRLATATMLGSSDQAQIHGGAQAVRRRCRRCAKRTHRRRRRSRDRHRARADPAAGAQRRLSAGRAARSIPSVRLLPAAPRSRSANITGSKQNRVRSPAHLRRALRRGLAGDSAGRDLVGLWAANRLVRPISGLIGAAERVSEGDLNAQVAVGTRRRRNRHAGPRLQPHDLAA